MTKDMDEAFLNMDRKYFENLDRSFNLCKALKESSASHDPVNNPMHYKSKNGLECIDVIEGFELGYNLGNVVKYVLRAGRKDYEYQDLRKAMWYLNREIEKLQGYRNDE